MNPRCGAATLQTSGRLRASFEGDLDGLGSRVQFTPGFLNDIQVGEWWDALFVDTPWTQDTVCVYGKKHKEPRLTCLYGSALRYAGKTMSPLPWDQAPSALRQIRRSVEESTGCVYDVVLLNLYRDGRDKVSYHSDKDPSYGDNPTIASVSLGGMRKFVIRPYREAPQESYSVELRSGDLIVMKGAMQRHWHHAVPPCKKAEPRINLTFRQVAVHSPSSAEGGSLAKRRRATPC